MGSKKTCKERGEWAELCFMARAADRGLNVSRPHGDSASYDVGVEQNGRFLRIQVKSTTFCRKGSYTSNITGPKHERYPRGKVDFFAVYLVPVDVWYIIPFDVVEGNLSLNLTPRKGHKFAQYMEGWNLLRGRVKASRKKSVAHGALMAGENYWSDESRPHFSQTKREMGHPLDLPQSPALGRRFHSFPNSRCRE
jgi:hypothetical protein